MVRYTADGHYACHLDSGRDSRRRRPLTIVAVLQAPDRGGALAFPFAQPVDDGGPREPSGGGAGAAAAGGGVDEASSEAHPLLMASRRAATSASSAASRNAAGPTSRGSAGARGSGAAERALHAWVRGEATDFPGSLVRHYEERAAEQTLVAASMSDELRDTCWSVSADGSDRLGGDRLAAMGGATPGGAGAVARRGRPWGVQLAAERGQAALWYNHRLDARAGGWRMNEDHLEATHCGCTVHGATDKWILNVWPTYR